jgi:hypothetical protein
MKLGRIAGDIITIGSFMTDNSLIDASKQARVEPVCVISRDCLTLEYLPEVLSTLLNIFAGYYLQAVSLSAVVGGVKVSKILDRFNPDRTFGTLVAGYESIKDVVPLFTPAYTHRLPTNLNKRALADEVIRISMEAPNNKKQYKDNKSSKDNKPEKEQTPDEKAAALKEKTAYYADASGNSKVLNESSNLAVGKVLEVKITVDKNTAVIPIIVRLASVPLPTQAVIDLLGMHTTDKTFTERFHAWRAGRIRFIRDLILCQDLITERKRNLMSDNNGIYAETISRANASKRYGLLSGKPSMATASNIYVITEEVAHGVERKLGGRLSTMSIRDKAFKDTYAMIICVIDRDWERVTFYYRGIDGSTQNSIKEIKKSDKYKEPNVLDVLKSLNNNTTPGL